MAAQRPLEGRPHHRLLVRHRPRHGRSAWPRNGLDRLRDRAPARVDRRPRGSRLPHARARRHRRGVDAAAVAAVEAEHGAVGVLVNNAGYSQSGAIETRADGRRAPPVRDERLRARAHVPARAAGDARPALGQDRERLARWAANFVFPGGGYLPRDASTRSRRSATRCASRSRAFGVDVVIIQPGLIRTGSATRRSPRSRTCRRAGRTASSTRRSAEATHERLREGPAGEARRRARDVAKAIERAISAAPPEDPLPRHAVRPPAARRSAR